MNGTVVVRRARFRCTQTGRFYCPLDELLDLPTGEVTVSLARRAMRLATYMSFATLQEELQIQHEVRLADTVLNRLMQTVGTVAEQDRQAAAERLSAVPEGMAREARVPVELSGVQPKRLYISTDGIMYPTRYREKKGEQADPQLVWQEMKCGTVFWQEPDGQWQKRVLGTRDSVERFGLSLWRLAMQCGLLSAEEVIFISDGGAWCETVARTYFHDATRILDWYHLSEYVWAAGRSLYTDEAGVKRWVNRCLTELHDSSGIGLLRYLERSRAARRCDDLDALDDLISYLRPRLAATDYVDYRAAGYVIGSGMMESTCKQLVGQRLKGTGCQWSEAGAVAMTALIAQRLNQSWDAFWASRPLQRAA